VYVSHSGGRYKLLDQHGRTLLDDTGRYPTVFPVSRDSNNNFNSHEVLEKWAPPTPQGHDRYAIVLGKDDIGDGFGGIYKADTGDTTPPQEKTYTKIPIQGNADNGHWKYIPTQAGNYQINAVATIRDLDISVTGAERIFFLPTQQQWFIPTQIDFLVKDEADGNQNADAFYELGRFSNGQFFADQTFTLKSAVFQNGVVYSHRFFHRKAYATGDASLYLKVKDTNTGGQSVNADATLFGYFLNADAVNAGAGPVVDVDDSPPTFSLSEIAGITAENSSAGEVLRYNGTEYVNAVPDYSDLSGTPTIAIEAQANGAQVLAEAVAFNFTGDVAVSNPSGGVAEVAIASPVRSVNGQTGSVVMGMTDLKEISNPNAGHVIKHDGSNFTNALLDYAELANTPDIPSQISDLTNDSGFISGVLFEDSGTDIGRFSTVNAGNNLFLTDNGNGTITIDASPSKEDVGLGNVPNEDATNPANWDPAKSDGNFLVGDGTTFIAESGSTARSSLGLGDASTKNVGTSSSNVPQNSDLGTQAYNNQYINDGSQNTVNGDVTYVV
ncbi:MAG: hypothetical protein ABEI54_03950, partial [Candidatus Bipolaricaulia bacterium]